MKEDIKRFTFRVPSALFDQMDRIAQNNHRSVNAEIIIAIEQYIKSTETFSKESSQSANEA